MSTTKTELESSDWRGLESWLSDVPPAASLPSFVEHLGINFLGRTLVAARFREVSFHVFGGNFREPLFGVENFIQKAVEAVVSVGHSSTIHELIRLFVSKFR